MNPCAFDIHIPPWYSHPLVNTNINPLPICEEVSCVSNLPNMRSRENFHGHSPEDHSLDIYLRDIAKIPLISAEEEIRLARRIKLGDKKAEKKLVEANLRFVVTVAKQYQNQGLSLVDLINEGNIGITKAAKRFDETRGFKFISYAVWWIRQAIKLALAEQSRIVRIPVNQVTALNKMGKTSSRLEQKAGRKPTPEEVGKEIGFSPAEARTTASIQNWHRSLDAKYGPNDDSTLLDTLEDEQVLRPDAELEAKDLRLEIERVLCTLTAREAEVITLYFNLNHEKALTLEEIGERFSLTRERVRQIKEKAINRLRHESRSRSLRVFLS